MEDTTNNAQGQPEQSALSANLSTTISHVTVSETDIDPALLHVACIPTQTPSGERIPKEQFEAQL